MLCRLHFRQLARSKSKSELYGYAFGILYLWIIEVIVFLALKDKMPSVPPFVMVLFSFLLFLPDFICKLIFVHDTTVMDAVLKTRPIDQGIWDRFLSLSQLWSPSNVIMPLSVAPVCFFTMPFFPALADFLFLYLASAFGGFLVMLIKHRGTYQSENSGTNHSGTALRPVRNGYIQGIQTRSALRSKRLRNSYLVLAAVFYLQIFTNGAQATAQMGNIYGFFFIFWLSMAFIQNGFAIEANFFSAIWTKPVSISRILNDKYRFGLMVGFAALLLCIPLVIFKGQSIPELVSYFLYSAGFCNMVALTYAYKCTALDMFGKTFYNAQSKSGVMRISSLVLLIVLMLIGICLNTFIEVRWHAYLAFSALGLVGILLHRLYFRWVESRFMKNRYKYMDAYFAK